MTLTVSFQTVPFQTVPFQTVEMKSGMYCFYVNDFNRIFFDNLCGLLKCYRQVTLKNL